jgi:large subunit ribosomal protein L3
MLGLIGRKLGMTQVYDENGVLTPVTAIQIEDNVVVGLRKMDSEGYSAVVLGSINMKKNRVTKPYAGQFKEKVDPKKYLVEMRDFDKECAPGDSFNVELFDGVEFVDVTGKSKGKGFQGGMKRHGFGGGRQTHGSKFHRDIGGTAMSTTPGRTAKGRKMAGRTGGDRSTVQNLRLVKVDAEKKVLLVKGAVPGPRESIVVVKKAVRK